MFKRINLKHVLISLLIYLFLILFVYYFNFGIINVQASTTFDYKFIPNLLYCFYTNGDSCSHDISNNSNNVNGKIFYVPDSSNGNRMIFRSFSQEINFTDRNAFYSYFNNDDLVYMKGIYHFKSYYDISLVSNFSFIQHLTIDNPIYHLGLTSDLFFEIDDYEIYITIDDNDEYAYNEIILFSIAVPFSELTTYSSLYVRFTSSPTKNDLLEYAEVYGSIPTENKNSFAQINQFVISDEPINMTLADFDDLGEIRYDDVEFPREDLDNDDSFISNLIDNIINKFKVSFYTTWIRIRTLFTKLFVPDEGFFQTKFDELKNLFELKFSIFTTPIRAFISLIERFLDLSSVDTSKFVINVPEYTIPGFNVPILKASSYDLATVLNHGSIKTLWTLYLDFIDCFLVISFLNFSWNKLSSFFGDSVTENDYYSVDEYTTYDSAGKSLGYRRRVRNSTQVRRRKY